MSEFHDPFPNYEMLAHHDEESGKKIRRKLWNVFWLLLIVTLVEVFVGVKAGDWELPKLFLKFFFIGFTIVKAFYIVYVFMHLGDEERTAKWFIIAPFTGFILYLIVMLVMGEGNYSKMHKLDPPAAQTEEAGGTK
ncbi:MAG TPA: cytochrome C oxidase subunit IV family protein [Bacteroidia bacterium]|jgi:heme/copper-type cytochrome/quinol oxidase subunit 4|nr:cytochrome C oxidase subunit IV family protein [Bacteroidia bacterium]